MPSHFTEKEISQAAKTIKLLLPIEGKGTCFKCNRLKEDLVGAVCLDCRSTGAAFPDNFEYLQKWIKEEINVSGQRQHRNACILQRYA